MSPQLIAYANLAGIVAVAAFLWMLHRDIVRLGERVGALAERVARLEGLFEGFTGRQQPAE